MPINYLFGPFVVFCGYPPVWCRLFFVILSINPKLRFIGYTCVDFVWIHINIHVSVQFVC